MMNERKKAQERKRMFGRVATLYLEAFAEKHDLRFEFWVADDVGDTACFGDYFFHLDDMRYDLDNDLPKGMVIEWYEQLSGEHINLPSWANGLRPEHLTTPTRA